MNNKRGFTLVEVLVVVLIIGILAAIAVPSYNYAVEKSRASYAITSLKQIAKAQTAHNARVGSYSTEARDLTLDMKDSDGTNATGSEFADKFFKYKLYGDAKRVSTAERSNGEYELSIDYATGKLYCRPTEHKICKDLNLDEGRSYEPQWAPCSGEINSLWKKFGVSDDKETTATSCEIRLDEDANIMDFNMCFKNAHVSVYHIGLNSMGISYNEGCMKGSFLDTDTLTYSTGATNKVFLRKVDDGLIYSTCSQYDKDKQTCTNASIQYKNNEGYTQVAASCTSFDEDGLCMDLKCTQGDCGRIKELSLVFVN